MNQRFLSGNPPLEINLRPSKKAKRMSLRVSRLDGKVTLTFPFGLPEKHALEFADEKQDWLRRQLLELPQTIPVGLGSEIPVQGALLKVEAGQGRRVQIADAIQVPGQPDRIAARLLGHLKQYARAELAVASDRYARRLGTPYARLTIRDPRSRWGSCSSSGGLMYSWRLIMAPPDVLDYVAAHEVAHLQEMNHSADFWALVRDLFGDYEEPRQWLRNNGHDLHRYRFEH